MQIAKRDISNQKFNKLLAIRIAEKTRSGTKWECICDCGRTVFVSYSHLTLNAQKSCGCNQCKIHRKSFWQAAANKILGHYKNNARRKNMQFSISDDVFFKMTKMSCFYCGIEPSSVYSDKSLYGDYVYNGIDRIDNAKGYESNNIVSCCAICNMMKKTMSQGILSKNAKRL